MGVALAAMLLHTAVGATAWTWEQGWPAGWRAPSTGGWHVADGSLRATCGQDAPFPQVPVALGSRATVTFEVVAHRDTSLRGLGFGLSAGDAADMPHRAVHLTLQRGGKLAWFDGANWRDLCAWPPGEPLTVTLQLDLPRGQWQVAVQAASGARFESGPLPLWNQVVTPDTLFLNSFDPDSPGGAEVVVRRIVVDSDPTQPPRPRLKLTRIGARAVRVSWSCPLDGIDGFEVLRDGEAVAALGPLGTDWVDDGLAPATRCEYRVRAKGGGESEPARLVTGPGNEVMARRGQWDAIVYAATPGGLAAAVTLGRAGRRVALVEPGEAVGGMITGGLSRTDFGSIHALGGLFKDFLDDVLAYYIGVYGPDSAQVKLCRDGLYFEPQVARKVFLSWLADVPTVELFRSCHLVGANTRDGMVRSLVVEDRRRSLRFTLAAKVFIDASYEGDLAAYAGGSYLIGRESATEYGEKYAGELWWDVWERKVVDRVGTGDRTVQAYCYRLCLTTDVDNRLPPPPPQHYDRRRYLSLLPDIQQGRLKTLKDILSILELPNHKADANNHPQGNPSSDLVHGADAYPEATHAERVVIAAAHRDHILGLLWFLRNDPAVPESLRLDTQRWGLPRDEFPESDGWPSELYVREGRRIVGDEIFTEHDAMAVPGGERPPIRRDSIAVGAYPIDSHATGGRHPEQPDWLEGFFYLARGETKPYQIPYGIMLPRGLDGVLVCGCVSATHVGYGTLRMEPVFMALGTAAGVAADHALAEGVPPRRVRLPKVQRDLLGLGQVITVFDDVGPDTPGRDGFNLWGTMGAFPSYQAQPGEPLTGRDLRHWLGVVGDPRWVAAGEGVPDSDAPLTRDAAERVLQRLATGLAQPQPPLVSDGPAVSRGAFMAALAPLAEL